MQGSGGASPGSRCGIASSGDCRDPPSPPSPAADANTQPAAVDAAVQYEAPAVAAVKLRRQVLSPELAAFLRVALPRCEEALQQNELLDVLRDELAALAQEEEGEGGHGGNAAGRSAAASLAEHHSLSDLLHSKNRVLPAAGWHPTRRGVVAVACTLPQQCAARGAAPLLSQEALPLLQRQGQEAAAASASPQPRLPPTGCILVWNYADTTQPEAVLQAPAEVLAFAFHPTQPHWLAAGLVTGQVALFHLQPQQQQPGAEAELGPAGAVPAGAAPSVGAGPGHPPAGGAQPAAAPAAAAQPGPANGARAPALLPLHVSMAEAGHLAAVTDLQWLPGATVSREGRLGCAAPAAQQPGNAAPPPADACTLFASAAADGGLLLWDMRITTRPRKGATTDEEQPDWKPALALAAASTAKQPLPATRFCRDARGGGDRFVVGSLEGELTVVEAATFLLERKGNMEWAHNTVQRLVGHTGRVVGLAMSPYLSDALLVVGDSGFVVWRMPGTPATEVSRCAEQPAKPGGGGGAQEGSGAGCGACLPIFRSPCSATLYTCGCWSSTKPGVILLGRLDGRLEVWDLLDRTHQPALVAPVAPCALTSLTPSPQPQQPAGGRAAQQQLLAAGDAWGTLHLLELPRALRRRGHTEACALAALLQQEERRLAAATRRADTRLAEQQAAAEAQRAEAAAALVAARRQQKEQEKAEAGRPAEEAEEQGGETGYLALVAEWRARLLGGGDGAGAVPVQSCA